MHMILAIMNTLLICAIRGSVSSFGRLIADFQLRRVSLRSSVVISFLADTTKGLQCTGISTITSNNFEA
jgi:hypothetical protein